MSRLKTMKRLVAFKEMEKEEIELETKQIRQAIREEEAILHSMEDELAENIRLLSERKSGQITNTYELGMFYDYIGTLKRRIEAQQKVIAQKIHKLEAKLAELVEAYREKKLFESLKDKLTREEKIQQGRRDQRDMDSIWLSKVAREREV